MTWRQTIASLGPPREGRVVVLGVLALALTARLLCFGAPWIVVTADSPSFVSIALDLGRGELTDPRLGTVRLPGYPLLLALLDALSALSVGGIAWVQAGLGAATAAVGASLGLQIGSRPLAWTLGATLALHPALLLFEHGLMSESLGVALAVLGARLAASFARTGSRGVAALAGAVFAAALLTRLNLLPVALVASALALGARWRLRRAGGAGTGALPAATALLAGFLALAVPWLVVVERAQGAYGFFPGGAKLRLANAIELGLVSRDEARRALGTVDVDAVSPGSAYLKKLTLGAGTGEREAAEVVRAAFERSPGAFLRAAGGCALSALGWRSLDRLAASNDLGAWLDEAKRAARGDRSVARRRVAELTGAEAETAAPPAGTWLLRVATGGGIVALRGLAVAAGVLLLLTAWLRGGNRARGLAIAVGAASVVVSSAALFALSLVVRQRFAFPLDWIAFALPAALLAARPTPAEKTATGGVP